MKSALHLALATVAILPLAAQDRAFLIDSNLDQLFSVDLLTGAATLIGRHAAPWGKQTAGDACLQRRHDTRDLGQTRPFRL